MQTDSAAGYYGKIPSQGDFIQLRLPRPFLQPWDEWLQAGIAGSRERLGKRWLDIYLTSPVWRFALSSGVCGETGYAGVMIPSVDRVGRCFPFTLAAPLAGEVSVFAAAARAGNWFTSAEALILSTLDDTFARERFEACLGELGTPPLANTAPALAPTPPPAHTPLDSVDHLESPLAAFLEQTAMCAIPDCTLWWSHGSDRVAPSLLSARGLPRAAAFDALLTGQWGEWS